MAVLRTLLLGSPPRSSATEREQWLEAIAKAIDDYTKKKITFISSRSQDEVTYFLIGDITTRCECEPLQAVFKMCLF